MALVTQQGRFTDKNFAAVPPLLDHPAIQRSPAVSNISSLRGPDGGVDLAEGCLVTKTVKYTHQLAHWINAVPNGDPTDVVSTLYMRIVATETLLHCRRVLSKGCALFQ